MKKTLSIVLICGLLITIGGVSVFADTSLYKAYTFLHDYQTDQDMVGIYVTEHLTDPILISSSSYDINSGQQNHRYFTIKQDLDVVIKVTNRTTDTKFNMSRINLAVPLNSPAGSSGFTRVGYSQSSYTFDADNGIEVLYRGTLGHSSGAPTFLIHSGEDRFIFLGENQSITIHVSTTLYSTYFSTSNSISTTVIMKNLGYTLPSSLSDDNLTVDSIGITTTTNVYNDSYNIHQIERNVQSILDQYTANAQNAQAVTNGTQTNEQTLSNIGTNEDTWFTQNDQALQATGITNFNYTPTIMSGMSVISDQFNRLWLAIGDWNFVYTFSMMLGLVVLILRHNPQRKKSSSSGSGGGKSNASSS